MFEKKIILILSFLFLLTPPCLASIEIFLGSSQRGVALFDNVNTQKVNPLGLAFGGDAGDSKTSGWEPWTVQTFWNQSLNENKGYGLVHGLRLASFHHPQWTSQTPQSGIEFILDSQFKLDMGSFAFILGPRFRKLSLSQGDFASSGQLGLSLGFIHVNSFLEVLIEGGLMANGLGAETLGVQRDASSLKIQMLKPFEIESVLFKGGLEFYHQHRSYYGSTFQSAAYFVDDAQVSFLLGVVL